MIPVAASTVFWKVVPPELVILRLPISVPTVPVTEAVPKVLMVKLLADPPAVPAIAAKLTALLIPVPTVRVAPFSIIEFPNVMAPVDIPPTKAFPFLIRSGAFKFITPVPSAATVPIRLINDGLEAVTPPLKLNKSVPALPRVNVPRFKKEVLP